MAQGRGSAMVLRVALLCLLIHSQVAESAIYTVGDRAGWTFNMVAWPQGKRFRAGDTVVFSYNPAIHNVVSVTAAGYNSCKTPRGSKVYTTGKDRITLKKGTNYFICNFAGHCEAGMKVAITAV